jgi:hypothetical protein
MNEIKEKNNKQTEGLTYRIKLFFKARIFRKFEDFLRNPIIFWLLMPSLFFNIANWIVLAVFIKPIDKTIILHYNVYFGVDSMGHWSQAYIMPSIGLILLVINLFLADYFYLEKERVASYILLMSALMAQLSLLVASASIILINY